MASGTPSAAKPLDMQAFLKEAGATALVVFALAFSLVGFRTLDIPGGVTVTFRIDDLVLAPVVAFLGRAAIILLRQGRSRPVLIGSLGYGVSLFVLQFSTYGADPGAWRLVMFGSPVVNGLVIVLALIFAGRAAQGLWRERTGKTVEEREAAMDRIGARVQRAARFLGPLFLAFAVVLPFLPMADRWLLDIAILVITYVMLGWGLNIVVGLAGLLDLGYVAFYAVGAYSYALLAENFGMGFWVCPALRRSHGRLRRHPPRVPGPQAQGDYLAIVTLGFGEMVRIILLNWYDFTNGPDGISGIPRPTFFGLPFTARPPEGTESFHSFFGMTYAPIDRIIFLYYLILILALITNMFTLRIRKLPVGRAWEALREDEIACRSLGINPRNTKLTAFAIGAMFGGFGGSFFATRQGFISPESFTFIESAIILAIVVLGGMGSQIGVFSPPSCSSACLSSSGELQQYRMLAFGAAMVLIMVWLPQGLFARREPTIRLPSRKAAAEAAG